MKRKFVIIAGLILVIITANYFYHLASNQSVYEGLSTAPCQDYTKPIVQNLSFTIKITINGKNFPIDPTLGHDYGNCLHDIFVNDSSGKVFIKANDKEIFDLGQFFDVWHKTFSQYQIFNYEVGSGKTIKIFVNGKIVNSYRETQLTPNEKIEIIYQ